MYSPPAPFGWGDSLWHQAECWLDYEVPEWAENAKAIHNWSEVAAQLKP